MQSAKLNPRQQTFLKLYTGQTEIAGNGTRCYMAAYNCEVERVAQTGASRLLRDPRIKAILEEAERRALAALNVNAKFVLDESVRLYRIAIGDEPVAVDHVITNKDGSRSVSAILRRETNLPIARQALELIGRHTSVQAFQDNIEHTHTHYLEQALSKRTKVIEGRAVNDTPGLPSPEPARVERGSMPGDSENQQSEARADPLSEREGATAD